ncbi:hypothetical protein MKLM6_1596 [Methylomonas koyamae]|uniref:Uncharacterized protein n=1 Tax=Methylomonas koyamae TaxID=702114 RepID=A0A291II38_9GAMM|nr:glycosyltransferase family 4 protein [Methylomonas koyamae]ATG89840.1 hypothetical protein MKLM6_1596 [Methylomonas koyamae]OAI21920.1 hypothetical protein A1356_20075 [Methylomonas koyamae]
MRIGLLIYGDIDSVSGGYLYDRKLVEYLRRNGEQVVVISLPPRRFWWQLTDNLRRDVLGQIDAARLDILIQDAMVQPSVFALNRHLPLPVVGLVHLLNSFESHPRYSRWLFRAIERRYLATLSGLIANSQTTLAQLQQLLPSSLPPHCLALPAADNFTGADTEIDADFVRRRALAAGPLRILVVGNVIRRKRLHVLIQALRQLPANDYRVTIAGRLDMEPGYVARIRKLINGNGLTASVKFQGPVQGTTLAGFYRQHQIMVLPSIYESYGIVYAEAQQFGLPAIGTRAGAASEIIGHNQHGYLIEPDDANELAAILKHWHGDRQLLAGLSENALANFATLPRWDDSCGTIHRFLGEICRLVAG